MPEPQSSYVTSDTKSVSAARIAPRLVMHGPDKLLHILRNINIEHKTERPQKAKSERTSNTS